MPPSAEELRAQLNDMHGVLLASHKALLDYERTRYEREIAPIHSPGEFLQLAMNDPFFKWLRILSGLITQIDAFTSSRKPVDPGVGEALLAQSLALLVPTENGTEFQRNYLRTMQESPAVSLAHAQWKLSALHIARPR